MPFKKHLALTTVTMQLTHFSSAEQIMISVENNLVIKQIHTRTIGQRVVQIFLQTRRFYKVNIYKYSVYMLLLLLHLTH